MQHLQDVLRSHPAAIGATGGRLLEATAHAARCAQACAACADACLAEPDVAGLVQCIRLDLDCADLCGAMATMGLRRAGGTAATLATLRGLVDLCVDACRACAEECERHAERHEHCRACAAQCRQCADACSAAMSEVVG